MASILKDFSRLCLHTMTTRPWGIESCIRNYHEAGIRGITLWRNILENKNLSQVRMLLDDYGMHVVSLCRGGFFPSADAAKRQKKLDDNYFAIDQAVAVGAPMIVLVCGSEKDQSLEKSREQILEGILRLFPFAEKAGIKLAIEPLHPMYAGDRSAVNTLRQANTIAETIHADNVGVALDVYHVWWDPDLETEIKRCAAQGHLYAFHVCDWKVPTTDLLNDRGLMGEGCINIPLIREWVECAGFNGYIEVEIFSEAYWAEDQHQYIKKIKDAYLTKT